MIIGREDERENLLQFDQLWLNLEILAEECAEVIRIKSKACRFGLEDFHPCNGKPNREALEEEVGHVLAMVDILLAHGVLTFEGLVQQRAHKLEKLPAWYGRRP